MKTSSNISTRKLFIGSVAVVVLAAAVFFFTFFQVKTVEVIGNDHYTEDELKEKILKGSMTSNAILAPLFYSRHRNAAPSLHPQKGCPDCHWRAAHALCDAPSLS